jgi:hypothetical protein
MTPNLPDTQKHVGFYLNNKEDFLKAGNKILEQTDANLTFLYDAFILDDNKLVVYGDYVKFDVFDQIMFRFDEIVDFTYNYRHKYQRIKKENI